MAKLNKDIWLIRHGTTFYNESDILQGSTDNLLSPKGIAEAEELARRLKDEKFELICTSPLSRALQTAEIINRYHQAPLFVLQELRELSFGQWEGVHYPLIKSKFKQEFQNWRRSFKSKPPGGESFYQVFRRTSRGMQRILGLNAAKIAIVGHATVNRAILSFLLRLPLQTVRFFRTANCSVSRFYCFEDGSEKWTVLVFWNRNLNAINDE